MWHSLCCAGPAPRRPVGPSAGRGGRRLQCPPPPKPRVSWLHPPPQPLLVCSDRLWLPPAWGHSRRAGPSRPFLRICRAPASFGSDSGLWDVQPANPFAGRAGCTACTDGLQGALLQGLQALLCRGLQVMQALMCRSCRWLVQALQSLQAPLAGVAGGICRCRRWHLQAPHCMSCHVSGPPGRRYALLNACRGYQWAPRAPAGPQRPGCLGHGPHNAPLQWSTGLHG